MNGRINFISPRDDQTIDEFDAFEDFVAVYLKTNGIAEILVYDIPTASYNTVRLSSEVGTITPGINQNYKSNVLRFSHSSPVVSLFLIQNL